MNWLYFWIGIAIVSLVIEFLTYRLYALCFTAGGLIAVILSAFEIDWYILLIAFSVVSVLMLLFVRKHLLKVFIKEESKEQENVNQILNEEE